MVKEEELTGKMEFVEAEEVDEECEHGIVVDDYCEDCRKEEINELIGITGRYRDEDEKEEIDLFDEETEIVVVVKSRGIEREMVGKYLNLNIHDFKNIEPGDISDEIYAKDIALKRVSEVITEIADDITEIDINSMNMEEY